MCLSSSDYFCFCKLMTFKLNWMLPHLQTTYCINEWNAFTEKLKVSVIHFLLSPNRICCFLRDVNSLICFSLITDSLSSFDAELCSLSLSLLSFFSPLLFFIRHQRTKLKQVSAPQLPWHAFPFSLNQKAQLHDTTNDLLLTPAKGSSGFHATLITLHLNARSSSNIYFIAFNTVGRSYTLYVCWLLCFLIHSHFYFA